MNNTTKFTTPDEQSAKLAEAMRQIRDAQAKTRSAAIDACLMFRHAMIQDPELAMRTIGQIATALGIADKTYKMLKQIERDLTALGRV